jgi:hypothetical protein
MVKNIFSYFIKLLFKNNMDILLKPFIILEFIFNVDLVHDILIIIYISFFVHKYSIYLVK